MKNEAFLLNSTNGLWTAEHSTVSLLHLLHRRQAPSFLAYFRGRRTVNLEGTSSTWWYIRSEQPKLSFSETRGSSRGPPLCIMRPSVLFNFCVEEIGKLISDKKAVHGSTESSALKRDREKGTENHSSLMTSETMETRP